MTAQTSSNQRRPSDTPAECWPALFERTCFFLPSLLLPWRNCSETEFQPHYQVEDVGLAQFKSKLSTFSHPFSSPQRRIHILICSLPHRSTKPRVRGDGCPSVTMSLSPVISPALLIKMAPEQNRNLDFSLTFTFATGYILRFSIHVPLIRQITLSLINTSRYYRRQKKSLLVQID